MGATAYGSRPINRRRRTRAEIEAIRERIFELLRLDHPMTVRQLFYQLVNEKTIDKLEAEYKRTVCRLTAQMRLAGEIEFGWIADNTRWMRKPPSHSSLAQALNETAKAYRRNLWAHQNAYVEIWLEKDAVAGVLYQTTSSWDVPRATAS
jgi:hypothetical protein